MGSMNPPRILPLLTLTLLGACASTTQVPDLGSNEQLYRDLGFVSKVPGDRAVFLAPLVEARRDQVRPASQGGFPIAYDSDDHWNRPVRDMIEDVLQRELTCSHVFGSILPQPLPDALVLVPWLTNFETGCVELDVGARSLAEIGLRVQVYGAMDDNGQRPLLHDQLYSDRQASSPAMVPLSTFVLAGVALRHTMQHLVAGLDGSNVSRTGMPPTTPAEATPLPIPGIPATPPPPLK
jgi:hypothetical protein